MSATYDCNIKIIKCPLKHPRNTFVVAILNSNIKKDPNTVTRRFLGRRYCVALRRQELGAAHKLHFPTLKGPPTFSQVLQFPKITQTFFVLQCMTDWGGGKDADYQSELPDNY